MKDEFTPEMLQVFGYQNGLFGIESALDDYVYNERFYTREEAEEWIAKGGEPTPMSVSYGNVLGEQGWPIFHDGKLVCWAKESLAIN